MGLQDEIYDDLGISISTYLILTSIEQMSKLKEEDCYPVRPHLRYISEPWIRGQPESFRSSLVLTAAYH